MNDDQSVSVSHPFLKGATALAAGLGVSSWSDVAALLATVYTACLLIEWWWKRFWRPFFEDHGWLKPRMRRKGDRQGGQVQPRMMVALLTVSAAAFGGIVLHESYTDRATVPTKNDRPTVGFGSTFRDDGTPVRLGDTITPPQAVARSLAHIAKDETGLKRCVTGELSQVEYDVLVDFAYQYGTAAACASTMVRQVNAGNYVAACRGYALYKLSGGYDCSRAENKRICGGVWARNLERQAKCLAAQ